MTDEQFKVFMKEVRAIRRALEAVPSTPNSVLYDQAYAALVSQTKSLLGQPAKPLSSQ
jgi:hypothetical protein